MRYRQSLRAAVLGCQTQNQPRGLLVSGFISWSVAPRAGCRFLQVRPGCAAGTMNVCSLAWWRCISCSRSFSHVGQRGALLLTSLGGWGDGGSTVPQLHRLACTPLLTVEGRESDRAASARRVSFLFTAPVASPNCQRVERQWRLGRWEGVTAWYSECLCHDGEYTSSA